MNTTTRHERFDAMERYTELPMLLLSILFIPVLIIPLLVELSNDWTMTFAVANGMIWAAFALELAVKTYLSPSRPIYLREHWFDVLIVAVPFFRPLRAARVLRLFRVVKVGAISVRAAHSLRAVLQQNNLHYVLAVSLLLVIACAAGITLSERNHSGSNIKDFGDGLWWAATTVTTVGYGDRFPVTVEGRAIATFLMLLGISLFSFITANVAAFLSKQASSDEPTLTELKEHIQRLEDLIREKQLA